MENEGQTQILKLTSMVQSPHYPQFENMRAWWLLFAPYVISQVFVESNGNLGVFGTLMLNSDTLVENSTAHFNLLEELQFLRSQLQRQQQQITQLQQRPTACGWEGIRCQCFYKYSASLEDYLVLLSSNCTNGQLINVRILNMIVASQINGCIFNTTGICDEMVA